MVRGPLFLSLVWLFAVPAIGASQIEKAFDGCKMDLHVQKAYPTKLPITLNCRVINQSTKPWFVIANSPFIEGYRFHVTVTDEEKKEQILELSNQAGAFVSAIVHVKMLPGETRIVPLAIRALPPGKYVLTLEKKHSAPFEVVDDVDLRDAAKKQLMNGFWSKDLFCQHVLTKLAEDANARAVFRTVEDEMFVALRSDNENKALAAVKFLDRSFSACRSDLVEKHLIESVEERCKEKEIQAAGKWNFFMAQTTILAAKLGTDQSLSLVVHLLKRDPPIGDNGYSNVQSAAVQSIGVFKQKKAGDELVQIAFQSPRLAGDETVIYEAAHALCIRKDPRSLGILIKLFHDNEFRGYKGKILFSATALYENPGVDEFLKAATNDRDPGVRGDAQSALRRLSLMREDHQKK